MSNMSNDELMIINNSMNDILDNTKNDVKTINMRRRLAYITQDQHILSELSRSSDECVRANVAGNENTPSHILAILSTDPSSYVREDVAGNLNTPLDILTILSNDNNYSVVLSIYENPSIPEDFRNMIETRLDFLENKTDYVEDTEDLNYGESSYCGMYDFITANSANLQQNESESESESTNGRE